MNSFHFSFCSVENDQLGERPHFVKGGITLQYMQEKRGDGKAWFYLSFMVMDDIKKKCIEKKKKKETNFTIL